MVQLCPSYKWAYNAIQHDLTQPIVVGVINPFMTVQGTKCEQQTTWGNGVLSDRQINDRRGSISEMTLATKLYKVVALSYVCHKFI